MINGNGSKKIETEGSAPKAGVLLYLRKTSTSNLGWQSVGMISNAIHYLNRKDVQIKQMVNFYVSTKSQQNLVKLKS